MVIEKPNWDFVAPSNVQAFCTQRTTQGASEGANEGDSQNGNQGDSQAPYASFNLAEHVGDNLQNVAKNRAKLVKELALPSEPIWLKQEHTNEVLVLDQQAIRDKCFQNRPYDAIYTQLQNVVCCVMTADCMPLLACNRHGTEVAAIHAGWRGMAEGIIEKTLEKFITPMNELVVWAGPTISQRYFEVGHEVKRVLGGDNSHYAPHSTDINKCYANLYALAAERLQRLGVIFRHSKACTYHDDHQYYSYRRDGVTGRQASLIWMQKE